MSPTNVDVDNHLSATGLSSASQHAIERAAQTLLRHTASAGRLLFRAVAEAASQLLNKTSFFSGSVTASLIAAGSVLDGALR